MQRHARGLGFGQVQLNLLPIENKSVEPESGKTEEVKEEVKAEQHSPIVVDVRTVGEFRSGAVPGAVNIPLDELEGRSVELGNDLDREITVYCASGARSAYAQRYLLQLGYRKVTNGGGISSMMAKLQQSQAGGSSVESPLVVDVRSRGEFSTGAYPGAVNIPLDELPSRINELGTYGRDIVVYCASGARSSYALQFLTQNGFRNVRNGGGIMQMMRNR
jgi:rhodanese-related sulfurtransferase